MFYNFSAGYVMAAKSRHSSRESLLRVLRLPTPYAFALGLALNALHVGVPDSVLQLTEAFRGAYTVLGMMMVGVSLAGMRGFSPDWGFMTVTLGSKFVAWPLAVLAVVWLDARTVALFTPLVHRILLIYAIVPLAASSVVLAALFRTNEEQVASTVLVSTLIAALYIPLVLSLI
jgi:predicted permease